MSDRSGGWRVLFDVRTFALLALAACGSAAPLEMPVLPSCPDAGTAVTYASFGATFMSRYCVECHGGMRVERGVDLTTVAGVRAHAADIYQVAVDTRRMPQMPPSPTTDERRQLGEWLSCGAP